MAVKKLEELLKAVEAVIGDSSSDESLALLEDISDTMGQWSENENWKEKYDTLDRDWRERYKQRFLSSEDKEETKETEKFYDDGTEVEKTYQYDDLFKEEK